MSYLIVIFFISILSSSLKTYPMDLPMETPVQRTYPLDFQPMKFANDPDNELTIIPNPIAVCADTESTFEGIPIEDLETVLQAAPWQAQTLVKVLTNTKMIDHYYRSSTFLFGEPGTGKTILAKAIAYKICSKTPWEYEYISSRAFMGRYRNQTGVSLRSYLKKIEQLKKPTLLIIDQLNKILEYTESSADDTSFASNLVCYFIDKLADNKNIFLLGLMDRVTKLDKRLKMRMAGSLCKIPHPNSPELRRIIFMSKCINKNDSLDPEITPEWLHDLLQANPAIQGRNYRGVALQIANKIDTTKDELHTITKQHILESIQEYLDNKQHIYYVDPYETNWDRRERLHVENMFNQYLASKQLNFLEETLEDNSLFSPDQRIILQQLLDFHKK